MERAWFMDQMKYSPNRKGIMDPRECSLMVYSPNWKGMVTQKIVFCSSNCHGKREKIKYKMYSTKQVYLYALHVVDKSNVTSSVRGICNGLYIFTIPFFFSLSLSIGKRSTTAKIWRRGGTEAAKPRPPHPDSMGHATSTHGKIQNALWITWCLSNVNNICDLRYVSRATEHNIPPVTLFSMLF